MKYAAAILWFSVAWVLALLSLPWICLGMGLYFSGDETSGNRMMERSPLWRFMDWRDK